MSTVATGRPGRPAACSREDALSLAIRRFLACERVDVQAIAKELGLARATMHRWFQTRDLLLGEALATVAERRLHAIRAHTKGSGARALLDCFDTYNRELVDSDPLRFLLAQEQERALRILTSSVGVVQPQTVSVVEGLLTDEMERGKFQPPTQPHVLAYAIVRLGEAFLYNDAVVGVRRETERLREVIAALLGTIQP